MASLVLGAAGAVVGSFFGPLGASIGWALGAAAGNLLFGAKGQSGPRLTDLHLQNSSYGQAIPIVYGMVRVAGNVIWSTDLQEHEQHSGGKGGPSGPSSFTYSASFAILLCEGPIAGVRRIWANGRLVWDPNAMDPADFPFTLYLGDETQLPDPTIEAEEGVGNVPAHRGTAYVVFDTFYLTEYGNTIPNFTFEVFTAQGEIPWRVSSFVPAFPATIPPGGAAAFVTGASLSGGLLNIGIYEISGTTITYTLDSYQTDGTHVEQLISTNFNTINAETGTDIQADNDSSIAFFANAHLGNTGAISTWLVAGTNSAFVPVQPPFGDVTHGSISGNLFIYGGFAYGTGGGTLSGQLGRWPIAGGGPLGSPDAGYLFATGPGSDYRVTVDTITGKVYVRRVHSASYELYRFDGDLNLEHLFDDAAYPDELEGSHSFVAFNGLICMAGTSDATGNPAVLVYRDDGATLTKVGEIPGAIGNFLSLGTGLVLTPDGIISLNPPPAQIVLSEIVSDLSVRAGLTTNQIDVTQLTDLVDGYVVPNQADVRTLIEPLQIAWPFDAIEHDVVMKFKRRRQPIIDAEIALIDLGAHVPPSEPPPYLVLDPRQQEVDLPRIVDVTFLNKETDYQNGEQRGQRLVTSSQLTTSVQLPIVMDNDKAKEIAESRLYEAWIEREKFQIMLARKWLSLEPGDIIIAGERVMRVTQLHQGADGVLRVDSAATHLQLYNQAAPAPPGLGMPGSGGVPPTTPPVVQDTDLILLDLPLIADGDSPVGFYAALAGHSQPSWPGATVYKSIDGGSTFNADFFDSVADTFGDCTTTLGDFTGGNVFDEMNSLTVQLSLGSGELASVSRLAVLNGANKAAVGVVGTTGTRQIEIIQFREATLVGTRTYTLSGLLRGRRGSDWMIPLHTSGEKFVLLPTSSNPVGQTAELYLAREYKAVTSGRPITTGAVIDFANWGAAALPYAPCHPAGAIVDGAGNIVLSWERRTRIGGTWMPYVDVPLSEAVEQYFVVIYASSSYTAQARVVVVNDATEYAYSAADQTADFGAPQATLYFGIRQKGGFAFGTEARGRIPTP